MFVAKVFHWFYNKTTVLQLLFNFILRSTKVEFVFLNKVIQYRLENDETLIFFTFQFDFEFKLNLNIVFKI